MRARLAFVVTVLLAASLSSTPSAEAAPNRHWIRVRVGADGEQEFVGVETVSSPSWVAWRELQVFG